MTSCSGNERMEIDMGLTTKKYSIAEIFYSVQGEGPWAGTPMIFVRMAGCNLHCAWCDTDFKPKYRMSAEELFEEVQKLSLNCTHICFTGGEPSMSVDGHLVCMFHNHYYALHMETNGMYPIEEIGMYTSIVVSPKISFQGMTQADRDRALSFWREQKNKINPPIALKIVCDETESAVVVRDQVFQFSKILKDWNSLGVWDARFIQPLELDGQTNIKRVVEFVLENPQWRISEQGHKRWGLR